MSEASERNSKNSAAFAQATADVTLKLFMAIAEFFEKEAEYAPQKALAKWIREGGGLSFYPVQGGCIEKLKYDMDKEKVPYAVLSGDKYLIIRTPDLEFTKELNRRVLIRESNYFQDVDSRELENAIARHDKIMDKEIFSLHNLSKYQTEVLKNKCNRISAGFMVGIGKEGDRFIVSIHNGKLYNSNPEKIDFCKAYLQMSLSLHGPNSAIKIAQIDADEKIDLEVESYKGKDEVHYVIGVDNPTSYIEINAHEFQCYEIVPEENGYTTRHVAQCSVDDPNYDSELQRYMDRIYNKAIINDSAELTKHLSTKDRTVESSRPKRDKEQYNISIANDKLADKIDSMIKKRIQSEGYTFPDSSSKFLYYEKEAANILESCLGGNYPAQYPQEDFAELNRIFKEYIPDSVKERYRPSIETIRNISCESHRAEKIRSAEEREVRRDYGFTNR